MERVVCRWRKCGVILRPKPGARFAICEYCRHVTCLSCDAAHEGVNCETFRTQSMMLPTDTLAPGSGNVNAREDAQASLPQSPRAPLAGGSPGITATPSPIRETRSPASPAKPTSPDKQTPSPRTAFPGHSPAVAATQTSVGKETRSPVSTAKPKSPVKTTGLYASQSAGRRRTSNRPQKTVQCAKEDCGYEILVDLDEKYLPCYKCRNTTCLLCKAIHQNLTCEDYQKQVKKPIGADYTSPPIVQPSRGAAFSQSRGKEATMTKTVQCASEDCGYEVSVDVDDTELPCYKCRNTTCLLCNAIHRDLTCEDYQKQLKPPAKVQEAEIQVRCAGAPCNFIAYVDASALQLNCPLCHCITCLQCRAVHEFETCEDYQANLHRSSMEEARSRAVTAPTLAVQMQQRLRISESPATSRPTRELDSTRTEESSPPFVASSEASARRDAPRQDAIPVQHAASEAPPSSDAVMVECCHCLVESSYEEITEVSSCGHFICTVCVHEAAVNSLTYLVLCPVVPQRGSTRCHSHIQESALKKVMSPAEQEVRKELLALPILLCPLEGCPGKFCARPGVQKVDCPACNNEFCVPCSASHPGSSCEQFIRVVAGAAAGVRPPSPNDSDNSEDGGDDVVGGASALTDSD